MSPRAGRSSDAQAQPLKGGGEFQINITTSGHQQYPSISTSPTGRFVVVWNAWPGDADGAAVHGRLFDSSGMAAQVEFQANAWTTGYQGVPLVGMGADTDFLDCPTVFNPAQEDANVDGVGDLCDLSLTSPMGGATVNCTNPALLRPTLTWTAGTRDRFRILFSPDPSFPRGARVSSGDKWLNSTAWTPSKKKWKKACQKATGASPSSPVLHIKVVGKDRDRFREDPLRLSDSTPITVGILN